MPRYSRRRFRGGEVPQGDLNADQSAPQLGFFDKMKLKLNELSQTASSKLDSLKQNASSQFDGLKQSASSKFDDLKSKASGTQSNYGGRRTRKNRTRRSRVRQRR